MALLNWPKRRPLSADAEEPDSDCLWEAHLSPGLLILESSGGQRLVFSDASELRSFAMQVYAAAIEHDLDVQEAAVKASIERRRLRGLGGNRHRPVHERPEPPAHMSLERPA